MSFLNFPFSLSLIYVVKKATDAVDYDNIDELADEPGGFEEKSVAPRKTVAFVQPEVKKPKPTKGDESLQTGRGAIEKGAVLKFSELFSIPSKAYINRPMKRKRRQWDEDPEKLVFEIAGDNEVLSHTDTVVFKKKERLADSSHLGSTEAAKPSLLPTNQEYHLFLLSSWEDKILWDEDERPAASDWASQDRDYRYLNVVRFPLSLRPPLNLAHPFFTISSCEKTSSQFPYSNFLDRSWEDDVIWSDVDDDDADESLAALHRRRKRAPVILDLNDDNMLLSQTHRTAKPGAASHHLVDHPVPQAEGVVERSRRGRKKKVKPTSDDDDYEPVGPNTLALGSLDPYNLSNDKFYEMKRQKKAERVRHGVGKLVMKHSLPTIRLDYPHFKTFISKADTRSFHRPKLEMPLNRVFWLQPPKPVKKDMEKLAKRTDNIRSGKDITLRDNVKFVMFEYSEENPPLMMKAGMSTLINNYYRKKNDSDLYLPTEADGVNGVLESIDQSPFAIFGDVRPGETVPTIANNLFRAPIFKHETPSTDFLVVKTKGKLHLREIPYIYTVGQTFPLYAIPHPNSRASHQYDRNAVEVYISRQFKRKDNVKKRLPIREINRGFNGIPTAVVKMKMREYAEVTRRDGDHVTWWYLKPDATLPSEEELRRKMTPEMLCAHESMMAAQQSLRDAGYKSKSYEREDDDEDEGNMVDDELKITPWRIAKNVIAAFQGKALLQMSGFGDPTGCGEGYSFVRVPMRVFQPRGESSRYNLPVPVAGTDGDLRKLSLEAGREVLLKLGVDEETMQGMTRFAVLQEIKRLSLENSEFGQPYSRQKPLTTAGEQQKSSREAVRLLRLPFFFFSNNSPCNLTFQYSRPRHTVSGRPRERLSAPHVWTTVTSRRMKRRPRVAWRGRKMTTTLTLSASLT